MGSNGVHVVLHVGAGVSADNGISVGVDVGVGSAVDL